MKPANSTGKVNGDEFFHLPVENAATLQKWYQWRQPDRVVVFVHHDQKILAGVITESGREVPKEGLGVQFMRAAGGFRWIVPVNSSHWLAKALQPLRAHFATRCAGRNVFHASGLVVGCNQGWGATGDRITEGLIRVAYTRPRTQALAPEPLELHIELTDDQALQLKHASYKPQISTRNYLWCRHRPIAVMAIDIETSGWPRRYEKPTEHEQKALLLLTKQNKEKQMLKATATCRVACNKPPDQTPCSICKRSAWTAPPEGQFGHYSFGIEPWVLKHDRVRVVQIGWCTYDAEGNELGNDELCVRDVPGGCSAQATMRHGLTNDHLAAHGVPLTEAMRSLAGALNATERDCGTLTAYNLEFDAGVLHAELARLGPDPEWSTNRARLARLATDGCCTIQWTKRVNDLEASKRITLASACEPYDIKTNDVDAQEKSLRHTALYDARLAGQLYFGLLKTHTSKDDRGGPTLQIPLSSPAQDPAMAILRDPSMQGPP
jgi:DNA polymerase III epsilon subunit-like protein